MAKILLVDDELTMVQMVADMLRQEGHEVYPFTNIQAASAALATHSPELVITDLYLDKANPHGMEILKKARELTPPAVVIVITGFGSIESAKEAMKQGAFDYLQKPFKVDEFKLCVQRALSYNAALSETVYLRKQLKKKYQFSQIIGSAPKMQRVFKMIERVADTDSTVLILGESGTGKELVARALHFNSRRQFAPFIPINCSALPENLLESELFGHERGAFTGAVKEKKGLFHEAEGGTLFLDEIGETSLTMQVKLLRALQERVVRRVGGNTEEPVDVRIICATNKDLAKRVAEGTLREALYYRINVIPVQIPPLRERRDDIPYLVRHFLKKNAAEQGAPEKKISTEAMRLLEAYSWPGNVRELENLIERTVALEPSDIITTASLPEVFLHPAGVPATTAEGFDLPPEGLDLEAYLEWLGKRLMHQALERTGGVQTRAAELLRMTERSFRYYAKKYGLKREEETVYVDRTEATPTDE